ncbi:MAG: carboxypeptidase regulatory-like domain-containing protein [Planctomycetes bacterium]|nr:carboxypeptidase regulatory-like domain-containing protein [Planctomycetota bacterium]
MTLLNQCLGEDISGLIRYEKVTYDDSQTNKINTVNTVLPGARVSISHAGPTQSTTTDANGNYQFGGITAPYTITVYSSNNSIIVRNRNETTYSYQLSQNSKSAVISVANNSGAFNIYTKMYEAKMWLAEKGITSISSGVSSATDSFDDYRYGTSLNNIIVNWPSDGTYYDPENGQLSFLGGSEETDHDEFDDDIILHEFGHLLMDAISVDHSQGGPHSITDHIDMRLAWSEGVASYVSAAIRNDSNLVDTTYTDTSLNALTRGSNYDINDPASSIQESTNEWAVSYILWNAQQAEDLSGNDGAARVFSVLTQFENLPSSVSNSQISLDTFHDVWSSNSYTDLNSYYSEMKMSYEKDFSEIIEGQEVPVPVSTTGTMSNTQTLYPYSDVDYYSFNPAPGTYAIQTHLAGRTGNGILTSLKLYKGSIANENIIATNNQIGESRVAQTSGFEVTFTDRATYYAAVSRFNSSSANYGLNAPGDYTSTAGSYGSYKLSVEKDGVLSIPITPTGSSGGSIAGSPSTPGSDNGGGGCLLR